MADLKRRYVSYDMNKESFYSVWSMLSKQGPT